MKSSIYFITDCHFSEESNIDIEKIESLAQIIKSDVNDFIYLAVSGDIAFSGKSVEYDIFCDFFNRIKQESCRDIRLITCPGNHDINFANEEYSLESLKNDTKRENVNESCKKRLTKIASYESFERRNVQSERIDNYLSCLLFNDDEKEILFYSLNNVLFSCFGNENKSDDTKNHAYLSDQTLRNIKRKKPNQVIFLLMHFPMNYFNDNDCHSFKERISRNVDIVLNGHLHVPEKEIIINKGNASILQGGHFSKNDLDESGSFIKIDLNKNNYTEFVWKDDSFIQQEDEGKISLNSSRWNGLNICFNSDYYSQISKCEILGREFDIDDIFVFPYLSREKYENNNEKETAVKDFLTFSSKIKNNSIVIIYGDEGSGKTSLSKYLTLLFFNDNYFPVLCDGNQSIKINDFEKYIKREVRKMYTDAAISKYLNEVPISNKILIVDDFSQYDTDLILEAKKYFKSIILISRLDKDKIINKPGVFYGEEILEYTIQPMVKSKRKEFTYKIYDALTNLGDRSNLTKEKFFAFIEKQLSVLSINDVCDPISLAYIEISAFHSSDSFDNTFFSNVNQAKSLLMLNDVIKRNEYNCNIESVNRIISFIAYTMYEDSKQEFSLEEVKKSIDYEIDNYGNPGIDEYDFSQLMIKALITKELKNRNFTFFNRDVFSYYIALFINIQIGDGNNSCFADLLQKDIFVPLNFNILMCLTSIYKNAIIPNEIIDLISKEAEGMPILNDSNFSIAGITKEKQEELQRLTHEDIVRINEKQDEYEKKKHEIYLKNKDNLYYVDIVSPEVKEINVWLDKLKISCVLLKRFSSTIKRTYKEKLINLITTLPNLVLYLFNDYLFKELDNLYATIKEKSTNRSIASSASAFNNFIVSIKRAFILSTYDYGSRCFTDYASKELLKSSIGTGKSELKIVQNLMLESFVIHGDDFISSCTDLIKNKDYKDNSFVKMSAKLIGRRYIVDNFDLCMKNYKSFVNLIFESPKEALQYKSKASSKK